MAQLVPVYTLAHAHVARMPGVGYRVAPVTELHERSAMHNRCVVPPASHDHENSADMRLRSNGSSLCLSTITTQSKTLTEVAVCCRQCLGPWVAPGRADRLGVPHTAIYRLHRVSDATVLLGCHSACWRCLWHPCVINGAWPVGWLHNMGSGSRL